MGISHEYHSTHGRRRRSKAGTGLRLAGIIAAILLLSLAITAILENGEKQSEAVQQSPAAGTAANILAPLPMQGDTGASAADSAGGTAGEGSGADDTAAVTLEQFGPARQAAGAYQVKAYDSSVIRQPSCGQVDLSYFSDAALLGDSLTVGFSDYSINLGGALICGYTGVGPDAIVNRSAVKSSVRGSEVAMDVLTAAQPKKLYILLGTNVLNRDGDYSSFLTYYRLMLDMISQALPNTQIYVQSITPVRPEVRSSHPGLYKERLCEINNELAAIALEKNCAFLNLWEALADDNGDLKAEYAQPDGIHIKPEGYPAWVEYLATHTVGQQTA